MKRLVPLTRPLFAVMLVFMIFACSGGGCSGCAGCGIYPIPGSFPIAERIPNSAQVRLSESGIQFIEDNISGIVTTVLPGGLDFDIPMTSGSTTGIDYTVCPDGDCKAHIEIQDLELTPTAPNRLHAVIQLVIDTRDATGARRGIPLRLRGLCVLGVCAVNTTCQADIDSREGDRTFVAFQADIDFVTETEPAREGYTRIDITNATLVDGQGIEDADISLGSCSGISGAIINALAGLLTGTLIGMLEDQVNGLVGSAIGDQLCTTQGEYGCPTGTFADGTGPDATCRFGPSSSDRCVPILLGMDGRGDLGGQFLGGFSPGAHAPIQLVLASGGDGEAINNGMSLFFVGGFMSMDRTFTTSPGHNPCVPLREQPPLPDVARVESFRGNVIPGTSTPTHIGIGIAEDYLNYAGYGMYDSGMLCIGAGTRLSQQLSSGLVSAAVGSLRSIAFPADSAPLTLAIRPQNPPTFTIGTDASTPLLSIGLDDVMIDFYVWSTERYVRFMTYQTDLTVRINLTVEAGEIVPHIEGVDATNSMVFNSEMITEQPAAVAATVETIISSFAGMLAGSISPIALPDIMGFELDVPPEGIRGVADGGERFLGIFANLSLATAPLSTPIETTIEVSDLEIDRPSMSLETWNQGDGNSAWLHFGGDSALPGADYEYSYRIDGMTWSHWTTDSRVRIDDDILLLQARHVIEARARIRGEAASVDSTPARAELIVDIDAPTVQLTRDEQGYLATAGDLVTPDSSLTYRFRVRDGAWSEWQSDPRYVPETLDLTGGQIEVEVQDEAGNVGSSSMALIRGIPNPAGGGCDCGVAAGNTDRNGPLALVSSLLVLGAMLLRRRRVSAHTARSIAIAIVALGSLALVAGCECGGATVTDCGGECIAATPPASTTGTICCDATQECAEYDVDRLCDPGFTCPIANVLVDDMCDVTCSMCERKPPLDPGLLATDLDMVVTDTGDTFVSGYSPGVPPGDPYGDLVFGQVQAGGDVDWEIVDGAPSMPIVADPDGWRGGVEAPGEDVGRWTAMAHSGSDFYVAYYDATNGALKLAIGGPGAWDVQTIDDAGDSGRYPSIVLVGGAPVISYLRIEPDTTDTTRLRSSVRVATASSAAPMAATDWTISEVAGAPMLCRPQFCEGFGVSCLESGQCATPTTDCPADCAAGEVCFMGTCQVALVDNYVEDLPPAYGLHTSLAATPSGLAIVWYDRGTGNLWGASQSGGTWGAPFLIDGYMRGDPNVGDSGIGASLFVDSAGTWHVTYVDGAEEVLRYAQIVGGAVTIREDVDNGATPDGTTLHDDGRHVVGDDSSVVVTDGGEVRVAYQDATDRTLMLARRAAGATTWTVSVLDDMDNTGFWAEQVLVGGTSYVATWYRFQSRSAPRNGIRVLPVE